MQKKKERTKKTENSKYIYIYIYVNESMKIHQKKMLMEEYYSDKPVFYP